MTDQFYTQRTAERENDPNYQKTMDSLVKQNQIYNTSPKDPISFIKNTEKLNQDLN